ncbi:MAG: hypothetical protein M3N41_05310 [Acidobacteriota bacterium]|nr:hypothetical protein [Acidobacteriota bacterium]
MRKTSRTPAAPAHFSDKSKKLWRTIHSEFELAADSVELLRVALENLDLADKARDLLRVEGLVVQGKKHPASDSVKLHDGMFMRGMRQLGLDVVAPGAGPAGRRN